MKVFISWSGTYSLGVAVALQKWLPYIFTDIQTFVSSEDVRKGKRWLAEITKELSNTNFGIVCLTRDNLEAPWVLFEAGALSKLKAAHVCTLLLDNLRPGDVEGPLATRIGLLAACRNQNITPPLPEACCSWFFYGAATTPEPSGWSPRGRPSGPAASAFSWPGCCCWRCCASLRGSVNIAR